MKNFLKNQNLLLKEEMKKEMHLLLKDIIEDIENKKLQVLRIKKKKMLKLVVMLIIVIIKMLVLLLRLLGEKIPLFIRGIESKKLYRY